MDVPRDGLTGCPSPALSEGFSRRSTGLGYRNCTQALTAVAPERFIDWLEIVEAWVHPGELDVSECVSACLVSTWKPCTRHSYATHPRRFATMGRTYPWDQTQSSAENVLLSMCTSRYQAGSLRGCVSALKAVVPLGWAPEVQWLRLRRLAKAPHESPCHRPYGGPEVLQLLGEGCKTVRDWKIFAGAVLSFSPLARFAEIASSRKLNITRVGITFQGLKRRDREVTRRLGPYRVALSAWLRKAPLVKHRLNLGSSSTLQSSMARLLQGTSRRDARWHAWPRASAMYVRAMGLPSRYLSWWGRW